MERRHEIKSVRLRTFTRLRMLCLMSFIRLRGQSVERRKSKGVGEGALQWLRKQRLL